VLALAEAIEAKDSYTQGHCQRVSRLSLRIAKQLGLPKDMEQPLQYAAILHDIGKIGIPERVLNKKGPLNEEEMEVIKMHPLIGAQILSIMDFFAPAINGVRHHHERWDGKGYPDGVASEAIDPLARIIALADTFDAMASTRPYRDSKVWTRSFWRFGRKEESSFLLSWLMRSSKASFMMNTARHHQELFVLLRPSCWRA